MGIAAKAKHSSGGVHPNLNVQSGTRTSTMPLSPRRLSRGIERTVGCGGIGQSYAARTFRFGNDLDMYSEDASTPGHGGEDPSIDACVRAC